VNAFISSLQNREDIPVLLLKLPTENSQFLLAQSVTNSYIVISCLTGKASVCKTVNPIPSAGSETER
jgi:hypothetical protein